MGRTCPFERRSPSTRAHDRSCALAAGHSRIEYLPHGIQGSSHIISRSASLLNTKHRLHEFLRPHFPFSSTIMCVSIKRAGWEVDVRVSQKPHSDGTPMHSSSPYFATRDLPSTSSEFNAPSYGPGTPSVRGVPITADRILNGPYLVTRGVSHSSGEFSALPYATQNPSVRGAPTTVDHIPNNPSHNTRGISPTSSESSALSYAAPSPSVRGVPMTTDGIRATGYVVQNGPPLRHIFILTQSRGGYGFA